MEVKKGYKQSEVGVIPEDWEVRRIDSVCNLINGRGFKPYEWKTSGLPIIRIQNLNGGEEFNYFQGQYAKKLEIANGQLLFAWSGSRGTSFGPHLWKGPKGLLNYHTWKVEISEGKVDKGFFLYALRQLTSFIEDNAHGASALVHTQKWEMEGFQFPLPPTLAEQQAIAGALSDADAWIESLEQLIAKKRQIKQGAMQELLTGKRRLPGFSGEWEETTLGELATFLSGGTPSRNNDGFWTGDIPWISASSLRCFEIWRSDSNVTKEAVVSGSKIAPVGSSLLLVRGSALHKEILCGLVIKPVCFNQDVKALVPYSQVVPRFLTMLIRGMADAMLKLVSSAGNTAGVLDTKLLKAFAIRLPTPNEQTAIATVLLDMDNEIGSLESKLAKAREIKQGMMQELLTGKIRLV
jgi:type I restriction enzyme S subunit